MGIVVSIAGYSGNGKTYSMGTMDSEKTLIVRPNRKPFSFPQAREWQKSKWNKEEKKGSWIYANDYGLIQAILKQMPDYGKKSIIIDDSTHLIVDEFMREAKTSGWDKYTDMGLHYYNMLRTAEELPDDVIVYVINHLEETPNGSLKIKTIGKLLDEKVDIPSLITIGLQAVRTADGYKFKTQTDGNDFFKSPAGMFKDKFINNNLKEVDDAIREYYGLED